MVALVTQQGLEVSAWGGTGEIEQKHSCVVSSAVVMEEELMA